MRRLVCSMGLAGVLALGAACSSSSSGTNSTDGGTDSGQDVAPDAGPPLVTISGTAAPHPLTAVLEAPTPTDFSMINVAVVDPSVVLANANAAPLKGGPLDTSAANCPAGNCIWSFDDVNISTITLGLVGILDDARTTGRLWLKTGTGAGAADFINMTKITRAPITNRPLFAVSVATEAKLALFAATVIPDSTIIAGGLNTRGFMIASIVSKLSEGATPVAGAVLTTTDTRTNIVYPNADFTGVGTSTAVHGTVLVVPKPVTPPTPIVTTWSVTAPSGDTRVWPTLTAGSTPGTAFVILFAANETP